MSSIATYAAVDVTAHTVHRLDFAVEEEFDEFRARFEKEVPPFSLDLVGEGDGWDAITERTMAAAPHGFLYYNRLDALPFFSRAGHTTPCTTYLMGNHVFAEQMFRFNPAILLYAPLRVAIYGDRDGTTHLTMDQPSTRFRSFADPEISAVGEMLDDRLAQLLPHLGIAVAK